MIGEDSKSGWYKLMKKIIYLSILLSFFFVWSLTPVISQVSFNDNKTIAISDQQQKVDKKVVEEISNNATGVDEPDIILTNKNIMKFYPASTLGIIYFNFTKENISKIRRLFKEQPDNGKEVRTFEDTKNLSDAFELFNKLSDVFGPEACLGFLKPAAQERPDPDLIFTLKVNPQNFSIEKVKSLLKKEATYTTEKYKNVTIHIAEHSPKDKFIFAECHSYFLVSNDVVKIKEAIDNYTLSKPNILSNKQASEAIALTNKPNLAMVLLNNAAIMQFGYTRKDVSLPFKKGSCSACKVTPPVATKKPVKPVITKNAKAKSRVTYVKKGSKRIVTKKPPVTVKKQSQPETTTTALQKISPSEVFPLKDIYDKLGEMECFTAIGVNLDNKTLKFESMTPYDTNLIKDKSFQEIIDKLLVEENRFDFARTLPLNTAGFVMITNLGRTIEYVLSYNNPDFQKDVTSFKTSFTTSTGLDLDKDILPLFYDAIIIGLTNTNNKTEPVLLLSNRPDTLEKLNKITSNLNKFLPSANIEESNINNKYYLTIISSPSMPFKIAYSKINDAIIFGSADYLKTFIDNDQNQSGYFSDSEDFSTYQDQLVKKNSSLLFLDFNELRTMFKEDIKKITTDQNIEVLNSLLVTSRYTKDKVFDVDVILNFK